jgi:hypothetical protein
LPAAPRPIEPWDVVYYRTDDEVVPADDFLDACPTKVSAQFAAVLDDVAEAPPPRYSGGGRWEAMTAPWVATTRFAPRGQGASRPAAGLEHRAQHGTGHVEGPGQVHVEDVGPRLVAHPHGQVVAGDAGVVDEDVDPAGRRRSVPRGGLSTGAAYESRRRRVFTS